METIKKQVSNRRGGGYFLLGKDKDGVKWWLEQEKWSCEWYWGFGYVETFERNVSPENAYDINVHTHFDSLFLKSEPSILEACSNKIYETAWKSLFTQSTLNNEEMWQLFELMKTAYTLKEMAELYHRGGTHITNNPLRKILQNSGKEKEINGALLPKVFQKITELLTPKN